MCCNQYHQLSSKRSKLFKVSNRLFINLRGCLSWRNARFDNAYFNYNWRIAIFPASIKINFREDFQN